MFKKLSYLTMVITLSIFVSGCMVAESKYLKKVAEADALTKDHNSLQQKYDNLTAENNTLKGQAKKLQEDLTGARTEKEKILAERDKLKESFSAVNEEKEQLKYDLDTIAKEKKKITADRDELDKVLKSKSGALSKTIIELRGQNAGLDLQNAMLKENIEKLEGENKNLQEEIVTLKKSKEEEVQAVSKTYDELLQEMKSEVAKGQVMVTELKGKLTVNVVEEMLFDSGVADIKPAGLLVLQRVIDIVKNVKDKTIRVEGHTDNIQIGGALARKYPSNWELSSARAINITKYLQKQGIDPNILSSAAYGEYKPVADNSTPEGRAKNRRIAIILLPKD